MNKAVSIIVSIAVFVGLLGIWSTPDVVAQSPRTSPSSSINRPRSNGSELVDPEPDMPKDKGFRDRREAIDRGENWGVIHGEVIIALLNLSKDDWPTYDTTSRIVNGMKTSHPYILDNRRDKALILLMTYEKTETASQARRRLEVRRRIWQRENPCAHVVKETAVIGFV